MQHDTAAPATKERFMQVGDDVTVQPGEITGLEAAPDTEARAGADGESIRSAELTLGDFDKQQIGAVLRTVPGGAKNVQDIYPLSPLQEGMLFHHLLDDQRDTYVLSTSFELPSRVHGDLLINALQRVINRHDVLRGAVLWENLPRPVQVIYRQATLQVTESVLDQDEDSTAQLMRLMKPGQQRIDLRRAPMLRLQLALDPRSHQWYAVLHVHHIICDHQSLRIVVSEALACLDGREQALPPPVAFRIHVAHALANAGTQEAERFFRRKLGEIDEPTAPFGLLDVHGGGEIEECREALDTRLAKRIRTQSRLYSVSSARLFHAAWGLVVARTSGRSDVVYGTVLLAARQRNVRAPQMLGLSVNTLPLRLRLQNATAKELIEQTHRELAELLNYEATPLTLAQRCSGIEGSAPLFTSLLNYRHSAPGQDTESASAGGVRVLARGEAWTNYPVTLTVDDLGNEFLIMAKTDRRLDPQRFISYLRTALESLVHALEHAPQTPALQLSILPAGERHQVIERFNETRAPFPREKLIHDLFEEQVKRDPQALAVTYEGQSLTYAELNGNANRLARYLRGKGVGPDSLVAICLERSVEMLVALFGVLKAGGAYIPLDPTNPIERLAHVLTDAAPRVLLTREVLKNKLPRVAAEMLTVDGDREQIERHSEQNLNQSLHLSPRNLAYVIYTSGSTGRPKGVMVEHRNVVNYTVHVLRQFDVASGSGSLICTSFGFDLMLTGLYPTLLCGRTVRLCREQQGLPALVDEMLQNTNLAPLKLTPSHLSLLEEPLRSGKLAGRVRVLVVGGESLPASTVDLWAKHAPGTRIFNHYGPTETTVGCVVHEIAAGGSGPVPIGRPISNTQIYILDRHLQAVPIGVAGEIYVGGAGVTRGYLNRPELTAERFLPDPFSVDPQARVYLTGDLGRWRIDETIEYLGRNDHQVKIRGFRIELGEIETQLMLNERVKSAVAHVREDVSGEKRLVAYVTRRDELSPTVESLRTHLAARLPEYMVPSAFVILDSLPLTPNGKIDRRALPAPELGAYMTRGYESPQEGVEEVIAVIWQSLLGVKRVGRYDNFWELGGHSLLIVQMMERIRNAGLSADLRAVFESHCLADLARVLTKDAVRQLEAPPSLIPDGSESITPEMLPLVKLEQYHIDSIVRSVPGGAANIQDIYPLVPLQEGILFHYSLLNESGGDMYVVPVVLSVPSRERLNDLISALQATVDRHDTLRTAVLWEQLPRPVQVVCRRAILRPEEITFDQQRDAAEQIREWTKPERQRLNPRHAPLMRLQVAQDRNGQWHALLQTHHLIADHVALEILISEVVAHLEGQGQTLPETVPYRNHVAQALMPSRLHEDEVFFRGKLADVDQSTAPFDLLNVRGDGSRIEEASEALDPELSGKVRNEARRSGVSAATIFHAAWALVIARTSGQEDVVFGTVLLGRMQGSAGAHRTLGMFINTLPLRIKMQGATAKELVEQTQRELMELLTHEQASLAVAQHCSGVGGSAPLFTAILNYRHSVSRFEALWARAEGVQALAVQGRTNYPITLSVDDDGELFSLTAQTDLRIEPTRLLGLMQAALQSLVQELAEASHTPALALSILPNSERYQVVELFNATQVDYPRERLIHEMFEEQAASTPTAIAVSCEGRSLTYAELNCKANKLARYLRVMGIGADRRVAICIDRSMEMVIGLLGILKAGGAYVPLDPSYPIERLHYMVEDAAPHVVLTQEHLKKLLPETCGELTVLDGGLKLIDSYAAGNIPAAERGVTAHNLVYVIYTSGSTGRPKGTAMCHRAMVNLIEWHRRTLQIREGLRVLQFAALSFDVTFQETFSTLCMGGTLVLLDEWTRRDAKSLTEFLISQSIERIFLPPLMLQGLAEICQTMNVFPKNLEDVITAGEQLRVSAEIVDFFKQLNGCRLHNHYGPTETHVVTALTLSGNPEKWPARPPIGQPISNTKIYVLDGRWQPVPVGIPGEIYIGGANVARGYLERPELTAERFLPDPFSENQTAHLYKTGDLGRWQACGTLEYLGRNDHQVKVRGYRIELGEIEALLSRHEQVREAAVAARQDVPGEKRVVAYVVMRNDSHPDPEELRAYTRTALPEFMVPREFVFLDALPLTPNGKLDRRALPVPGAYTAEVSEAPQGDIEEAVSEIWCKFLRVDRVNRRDNFFDLGGHSLIATRVITHISHVLEIDVPIRMIFEKPTVEGLSEYILQEMSSAVLMDAS